MQHLSPLTRPLAAALPGLLLLGLAVSPAPAQAPTSGSLLGVVTAVEGTAEAPLLRLRTGSGQTTIEVSAETRYELDDDDAVVDDRETATEAGFAADLTTLIGRFVEARGDLATDPADVVYVESTYEVFGAINAVAARRNPPVITMFVPYKGALRFTLGAEARVSLNGAAVPSNELLRLRGQKARVHYTPSGTVLTVDAFTGVKRVQGRITLLDVDAGQLSVKQGRQTLTFQTNEETDLNLDFQDARLSDLKTGSDVIIEQRPEGSQAALLVIHSRTPLPEIFFARAGQTSVSSGTLTVEGGTLAQPSLLKINAGSRITFNGRPANLSRITAGNRIIVSAARRNGLGIVRSLDARTR